MFKLAQSYADKQKQFFDGGMSLLGQKIKNTASGKNFQFPSNYDFSQNSTKVTPVDGASVGTSANPNRLTSGALTNKTSNTTGFTNAVSDASLPRTSIGGYGKLLTHTGKAGMHMGLTALPYIHPTLGIPTAYKKLIDGASSFINSGGDPLATAMGMFNFPKIDLLNNYKKSEPLKKLPFGKFKYRDVPPIKVPSDLAKDTRIKNPYYTEHFPQPTPEKPEGGTVDKFFKDLQFEGLKRRISGSQAGIYIHNYENENK